MPAIPPASTSPASAYDIEGFTPAVAPPAILADLIDPLTGDFASLTRGAGLADAFALEAIRIQRGTGAAVPDLGNRFREITHVEQNATELVESMAREAFADGEAAGVVELVAVSVEPNADDPAQLDTVVEYRDRLAPADAPTRRLLLTP